jgi:G3E family GTPase
VTTALPTIVVGGYLGAGKTTLVNHLLRHADGRRIAVMVNDFGEIGIDADLIESQDGDVLNLAGGCVCCSVGSDLIGALAALPARMPPPDLILIETSGVALPGSVARSVRLARNIEVDGVVVLADAEAIRSRAQDRYVGDTVLQQLRDADLLVLNKVELLEADALSALREWLAGQAPRARIVEANEAAVPPELVLGLAGTHGSVQALERSGGGLFAGDRAARRIGARKAGTGAGDMFASASIAVAGAVDARALAEALCAPGLGLHRMKGILRDRDGSGVVIQGVGPRWRIAPVSGEIGPQGRLVVIGLRGQVDASAIEAIVAAHDAAGCDALK